LKQRAGRLNHTRGLVADVDLPVGQHPHQRGQVPGETVGANGFALDDTGVAEGGFPAWLVTGDQGYPVTAFKQMPGSGYTDHAGSQYQNVARHYYFSLSAGVCPPGYPVSPFPHRIRVGWDTGSVRLIGAKGKMMGSWHLSG